MNLTGLCKENNLIKLKGLSSFKILFSPYPATVRHFQILIFPPGATQPIVGVYFTALYRALASSLTRLLDHTQRRATVGRTPLNE